jgi:hypothetical protein
VDATKIIAQHIYLHLGIQLIGFFPGRDTGCDKKGLEQLEEDLHIQAPECLSSFSSRKINPMRLVPNVLKACPPQKAAISASER